MRAILSDVNIQGHVQVLLTILEGETWRDLWAPLQLPLLTFPDLGLAADVSDADLWQACQQHQVVLITANRNAEGPDSLEATIRTRNAEDSLPVLTIADPSRILHSRDYAERAAVQMLDYLLNINGLRGTGRLDVP